MSRTPPCQGWQMLVAALLATSGCLGQARADTVMVFNEIMYHPIADEAGEEWIEFHNQMGVDVDISDWRVAGDTEYIFPIGSRIPGRGYLVLARDPVHLSAVTGLTTNVFGPFLSPLDNQGGTLELRDNSGKLMDRVEFGTEGDWPVTPDGAGPSVAKRNPDLSSAPGVNWAASQQRGGTPGTDNFPIVMAPVTVAFNELSGTAGPAFWLELMNWGTNPVPLGNCYLHHDGVTNSAYWFPPGTSLAPGACLSLANDVLGFVAPAPGEKLFLFVTNETAVHDGVVLKAGPRARSPDGIGVWRHPAAPTPGASNQFVFPDEIVINEIMYRHRLSPPEAPGERPMEDPEEWVELFNRDTNAVDLSGWEIDGGIGFHFPIGTVIPPGGYLVVARNAATLRQRHPDAAIVGNFSGNLNNSSDTILLRDAADNPADCVTYFDGGRWPEGADGGGSSLELRDPLADNAAAETWAASDETPGTTWQTHTYRMVAGTPPGNSQPTHWNDLLFGLLAAGECLVDDVRVLESPNTTAVPFIGNGGFEAGLTGWRVLGNHGRSHVIPDPDAPGNHVLHLIATGPQEHMHNHIEATLRNGASVVNGREYEISFRARWLTGNHLLNTRLYFNRCARTTPLAVPAWNGTPGAVNSRFATNLGPTFSEFQHAPVIPPAGSNVSVTVQASDPQGVTGCQLFWSLNGGAWSSTPMTFTNARYSGVIPGAPAGSIVQFHVQAGDGAGASYTYPARGRDSGALYVVADGQADLSRGRNVRLILSPSNRALLHASTNVMSNEYLPATVVCDESRAYYDVGVHLKGSERGRPNDDRVSFHVRFQPDDLFRGVHPHLLLDRSKGGSAPEAAEILIKHMLAQAGGIPVVRSDLGWLIAPFSTHTSSAIVFPRFEDNYLDESFPNGGDGTLWEYELIYSPTTTNSAGYKLPSPDTVKATAIQDLGDDPETYRYNFILKNHRDTDDYSRLIAFARSWSSVDTALEQHTPPVMDLDQWTRAYALVTLCGVGDAGSHNTLLYLRPGDERMLYFPWDMDFAFTQSATSPLVGDWLGKPNLQRIMNRPAHLRLLYANIQDVIASTYNPGYMSYWISHYNSLVPTASYGNVASYLQNRAAFASNKIQSDGGNAPFALTGPATLTTTTNLISLSGTAPVQARTLTVNGVAYPVSWTTLTNWSLRVPVTQASTVLQITVQDLRGNTLTQFSTNVTVQYTGAAGDPGRVVLNEIMAQPTVPGAGYVELYNSSPDHSFDLSGWRLNGVGYTFPPGTVLTNGQFLTLAANVVSHLTTYGTLPFAAFDGVLDPDGETLTLFRPGEAPGSERVVDRVRYEATPPWPPATNGASLQLLDAAQDNSRVANWGAVTTAPTLEWVYVTATGVPRPTSTPRALYLYLQSAGDIHLDDLSVVTGTVAQAGVNLVNNGGFEDGLAPWTIGSDGNNSASTLSTGISHSGNASLHLVASAGGTTRNSSIWQDCSPAIAVGGTYTLSFWFRQTANGGPLTVRFSGSGISVTTNPAPAAVTNVVAAATPGAANSLATNLPVFPPLWLNEVQVGNLTGASDNFGEREPWVELFNAGPLPLSLAGYFLTDTLSQPTQWPLPDAASVSATKFLVLWCDGQTQQSTPASPHASFRLTNSSGVVALTRLVNGRPQVVDYLRYTNLPVHWSYGDHPDGQPFYRTPMFQPTPGAANTNTTPPLTVFINEWLADNDGTLADPADSQFEDWFEIYNPGTNTVDLGGCYLSDDLTNKLQFLVPANGHYTIPPGGYLLVWADNEPSQNATNHADLHVNFALSKGGEAIGLFTADGTTVDAVTFGAQTTDVSEGRFPDGGAQIHSMPTPSPRTANFLPNTAPLLAAISNRFLTLGHTLTLTASATDADLPAQTLTFSLTNAPEGAIIGPGSGVLTWTPTLAPATHSFTVLVRDNGTSNLTVSRTFSVSVVPRPELGHLELNGGHLWFSWPSAPGQRYQLEYKQALGDAFWLPIGDEVTGSGDMLSASHPISVGSQRFYRIRVLP